MKKKITIAALVLLTASSLHARDIRNDSNSVEKSASKGLIVEYTDGFKEKYIVNYSAKLRLFREQTGEAASTKITWDRGYPETRVHAIDDRKCSWTIGTTIKRQVAMVNRAGEQFPKPGLETVLEVTHQGRGEGSNWTRWHAQTCGEAQGNFNNEVAGAKNGLISQFPTKINADFEQVKKEMASKLQNVKAIH
jgi:hypothetical protein